MFALIFVTEFTDDFKDDKKIFLYLTLQYNKNVRGARKRNTLSEHHGSRRTRRMHQASTTSHSFGRVPCLVAKKVLRFFGKVFRNASFANNRKKVCVRLFQETCSSRKLLIFPRRASIPEMGKI